jgi:hypothetical protein
MMPKLIKNENNEIQSLQGMFECNAAWSNRAIQNLKGHSFRWRNNSEDEILMAVQELHRNTTSVPSFRREKYEKFIKSQGAIATANISDSFLEKWEEKLY